MGLCEREQKGGPSPLQSGEGPAGSLHSDPAQGPPSKGEHSFSASVKVTN